MSGVSGTWGHSGTRCRIKKGWEGAGREGNAFVFFTDNKDQSWIALQWDGEDDPDLHKADGLELKTLVSDKWEDGGRVL
jgi:hypothetical protein